MNLHASPIHHLLALGCCALAGTARAAAPTPEEANTPLTSISKRMSYVFASTPDGLFRAPLETKVWERLKLPEGMPTNGKFASQPTVSAQSPLLFYVATRETPTTIAPPPRPGLRYGLYLSRDDGATWELVTERDDFGAVLLHPTGALFAVTGADGLNSGSRILRSPDLGRTWRDITGKAYAQFDSLEPDPDHPRLVRVRGSTRRAIMLVADDENYHWKMIREPPIRSVRLSDDEFFSRGQSTITETFIYNATLANYFAHDFGNRPEISALEILPLKSRFQLMPGARVIVPIRVVLHHDPEVARYYWRQAVARGSNSREPPPPRHVKLADDPDGIDFWQVRVATAGRQFASAPPDLPDATTDQAAPKKYKVVDLSPSTSYERDLDLSRFYDFSKPGEYRVQIVYNSNMRTDSEKGEWDGAFTSPVFTVVVQDSR